MFNIRFAHYNIVTALYCDSIVVVENFLIKIEYNITLLKYKTHTKK